MSDMSSETLPREADSSCEDVNNAEVATVDAESKIVKSGPYQADWGRATYWEDGDVTRRLCNFSARIVEDLITTAGGVTTRHHRIEAQLNDQSAVFEVSSDQLDNLRWVSRELGGEAIIEPLGKGRLPIAIRKLSGSIPLRHQANHTGWLTVKGKPLYVHASGAIGEASGAVISELPPQLARYSLPQVPKGDTARDAVRASLNLIQIGRPQVTVPVLAAVYRSVLGPIDTAVHLVGESGTFKSTLAGVALSHFGPGLSRVTLPASWSGTAKSLQTLAWHAKDALLVIDDFVPGEDNADVKAASLFRAQGNGSSGTRLIGGNLSEATRDPRGLTLSTGEALPSGSSICARLVIVPVEENSIDLDQLASAESASRQGQYAAAMAAYIHWLTEHYDEVQQSLTDFVAENRATFESSGQHARTAGNTAQLLLGFDWFLRFAEDQGCIHFGEARHIRESANASLLNVTSEQARFRPGGPGEVQKFRNLLRLAFHRKIAHALTADGFYIRNRSRWGWDHTTFNTDKDKPRGSHIGWVGGRNALGKRTDDDVYLLPDLAYQGLPASCVPEARSSAGATSDALEITGRSWCAHF